MIIETKNPGGRGIVRAFRNTSPPSYGYRRLADGQRALSVSIEGHDGKRYTVYITDADIGAINVARNETHLEAFSRGK